MSPARQSSGAKVARWRLLLLACASLFVAPLPAEEFFVRPESLDTGANTGADWDNAWRGFDAIVWGDGPGALGAGDTCWIAGGTYLRSFVVRGNGHAEHLLVLRRARATDPTATGAAGWRDAFDAPVVIRAPVTGILFPDGTGSHVVLDGQTPSGIRVEFQNGGTGVEIDGRTDVEDLTLRGIEAAGPGPVVETGDTRGFDLTPVATVTDLTLTRCSAHHADTLLQVGPSVDLIVEHCDFHHAGSLNPERFHPNVIYLARATRPIIRYNRIHDYDVEGLFFGDPGNSGALIHGNVFYQGATAPDSARGIEFDRHADSTGFRIHQNTFVDLPLPGVNFANGQPHPGASVRNNLFAGCSAEFGPATHDYNCFTTEDPAETHGVRGVPPIFVDAARFDYHLAGRLGPDQPRDRGDTLGPPFERDADDRLRGADGAWDIGAYEFNPPPPPPAPPPPPPPLTPQIVTVGRAVSFSAPADLSGLQWQVSRDGGQTFAPLADGPDLTGSATRTITLGNVAATQDGEFYRYTYRFGSASIPGTAARLTVSPAFFPHPSAIARDAAGTLFVADSTSNTIKKIDLLGRVTLFAGRDGAAGTADGRGAAARFNQPGGLALQPDGALFVADSASAMIRHITPDGAVTTVAGSATSRGNADGPAAAATFQQPLGLVLLPTGGFIVSDAANHTLRALRDDGIVRTVAGAARLPGHVDGPALDARFNTPGALAITARGELFVADSANNLIRRVEIGGTVSTFAGLADVAGSVDGLGAFALFDRPTGLAADPAGNLYVADTGNSLIRRIAPDGTVTTLAGLSGIAGHQDGNGTNAFFHQPLSLTIDPDGNLYIADTGNAAIRVVTPAGVVTTLALVAGPTPAAPDPPAPTPVAPAPAPTVVSAPSASSGSSGGSTSLAAATALAALLAARTCTRRKRCAAGATKPGTFIP